MTQWKESLEKMTPEIRSRACGGWLATSPPWSPVRIGVIAATQTDAAEAFRRALGFWAKALAG